MQTVRMYRKPSELSNFSRTGQLPTVEGLEREATEQYVRDTHTVKIMKRKAVCVLYMYVYICMWGCLFCVSMWRPEVNLSMMMVMTALTQGLTLYPWLT